MRRFDDLIWGTIQKTNDYYIPSEHVELLSSSQGRHHHLSHDFNRIQATKALQSGDANAFFTCFAHAYKAQREQDPQYLSGLPAHLSLRAHHHRPRRLVQSDCRCLKSMKEYAWLMDGIITLPCTKMHIGLGFLIGLLPFAGTSLDFLMSSILCWSVPGRIGTPKWFWWHMMRILGIVALLGFLPFIGDFFDSRAKPNIKIAHQVEMWLELRSIMSGDVFDQSADVWYSRELGDYMGLDRIGDAWYTKEMRMIVMGSNNEYLWRKGQDVDGCRC